MSKTKLHWKFCFQWFHCIVLSNSPWTWANKHHIYTSLLGLEKCQLSWTHSLLDNTIKSLCTLFIISLVYLALVTLQREITHSALDLEPQWGQLFQYSLMGNLPLINTLHAHTLTCIYKYPSPLSRMADFPVYWEISSNLTKSLSFLVGYRPAQRVKWKHIKNCWFAAG